MTPEQDAERHRIYRQRRIEQGLCFACGKPRGDSKSKCRCQECLGKQRTAAQKVREEKIRNGICTVEGCKNKAENGFHHCFTCRRFASEMKRLKYSSGVRNNE